MNDEAKRPAPGLDETNPVVQEQLRRKQEQEAKVSQDKAKEAQKPNQ
jgi:hypothetical protein